MFTYGSQVNPALLRQDFSAIMQGAQARAQGIAQGAQIRGQAMANLGSQIGSTMSELGKAYIKSREDNSILEAKNSAILSQNPELEKLPEVQKFNEKKAKSGGLSLNDNTKFHALLTTTTESAKMRQEQQARSLAMEANRFQLDAAKAAQDRANKDRLAMSSIWAEAGKTGKIPDQDDTIRLGLYYGLSPEGIASMLGVSQNSIEFGAKMAQNAAVVDKIKAENAESAARTERVNQALKVMPNGFREYSDGTTRVFQYIDYATGQVKSEMLKPGQVPANIQLLEEKQKQTLDVFTKYTELLNSPDRDSPENIAKRNALTERYNVINPKSDLQFNQTRDGLDALWGIKPVIGGTEKPASAPPAPTKSNIRGVSAAAPGARPTPAPAAAPAAAAGPQTEAQQTFNLIEDTRRRLNGGAQAAPVTTPAVDTTVAATTPATPPPVDLSAPASISGSIPFGPAGMERGEGADLKPTPVVSRALASAMRWADKNLTPSGKVGGFLNKSAFESARATELSIAQSLSESSDTPSKTFDEAMTNFGYRKSGDGKWEYKGPAFRAGTGSGAKETLARSLIPDALIPSSLKPSPGADFGGAQPVPRSAEGSEYQPNVFARAAMSAYNALTPKRATPESASIPFGPAAMDSAFLDREAQATVNDIYRPFDVSQMDRYSQTQNGIPQIKLSPAAQRIATELRRTVEGNERGKVPEFFLEASTGDNGKRSRERIKLDQNELFAILNSRSPNLSPQLYVDKEESWRMTGRKTGNFRPPPLRAR